MDNELYFHRCFVDTNHLPRVKSREQGITVSGIMLFVEEAIAYIFSFHGISDWVPQYSIQELRATHPQRIFFHGHVGLAMNHSCAIDEALRYAEEEGFIVEKWLQLSNCNSREHVQRYLEVVRTKTKPVNLSMINMLAFAGYLSHMAMQDGKTEWITIIIWRVIYVFAMRFPFEWIYYDVRQWAMAYNVRHYEIHNRLMLEDPFQESKPVYTQFEGPKLTVNGPYPILLDSMKYHSMTESIND